jgi:hypothetical protein
MLAETIASPAGPSPLPDDFAPDRAPAPASART